MCTKVHLLKPQSFLLPKLTLRKARVLLLILPVILSGIYLSVTVTTLIRKTSRTEEENDNSTAPPQEHLDWQKVSGSKYHFSVYSAYSYNESPVTVIGTTKTKTKEKVNCQFYYANSTTTEISRGEIVTMQEHWRKMYGGVFIRCELIRQKKLLPNYVSVIMASASADKSENESSLKMASNKLEIQYKSEADKMFNFSLCVLPTYNYTDVFHFIEWIEFYKLMGVEQFTFYNESFGPKVSCILEEMMKSDEGDDENVKVNVFPWKKFPINNQSLIRGTCPQCGLQAAINNCVYKHKGVSTYMVFVDLDEYIMSPKAVNYFDMMTNLNQLSRGNTGKLTEFGFYQFRNAFYARSRPNDEEDKLEETCEKVKGGDPFTFRVCKHLLMTKKSTRELKIERYNDRSKYILRPEAVRQSGTHQLFEMEVVQGHQYQIKKVPAQVATSRHYRFENKAWFSPNNSKTITSRIPADFAGRLATRTGESLRVFMSKCDIGEDIIFKDKD